MIHERKDFIGAQTIGYEGTKIKTAKDGDKAGLIFSDLDGVMNARQTLIMYVEMKEWGKNFNTGYDDNGNLIKTMGPIYRSQSMVDIIRPSTHSLYAYLWHEEPHDGDVKMLTSHVVGVYEKPIGETKGTRIKVDQPFLVWYYEKLASIRNWQYPDGIIKIEEQDFYEEYLKLKNK